MGWCEAPTDEARAGAPECQVGLQSCPMNHYRTAQPSVLRTDCAAIQAQNTRTPGDGNYC